MDSQRERILWFCFSNLFFDLKSVIIIIQILYAYNMKLHIHTFMCTTRIISYS